MVYVWKSSPKAGYLDHVGETRAGGLGGGHWVLLPLSGSAGYNGWENVITGRSSDGTLLVRTLAAP